MYVARALGWLPPRSLRTSPRAKPSALSLSHEPDYVAALQSAESMTEVTPVMRDRFHLGTLSNPIFPEVYRLPATGAGGVMLAPELVAMTEGAIHVPGGGSLGGLRAVGGIRCGSAGGRV